MSLYKRTLSQPWLPSGDDVDWSGGGTGLVASRIVSCTAGSACRKANAEIIKSRQSFYQQRLNEATGNHAAQWRIVRELVHSDDDHAVMQPAEARRLCSQFNRFFIDKLQRIARESKYVTMY